MKKLFKRLSRKIRERFFERYFFMIRTWGECHRHSTFTQKKARSIINSYYVNGTSGMAFRITNKKGEDVILAPEFDDFDEDRKVFEIDLRDSFKFGAFLSDEDIKALDKIIEEYSKQDSEPTFDFGL